MCVCRRVGLRGAPTGNNQSSIRSRIAQLGTSVCLQSRSMVYTLVASSLVTDVAASAW